MDTVPKQAPVCVVAGAGRRGGDMDDGATVPLVASVRALRTHTGGAATGSSTG